MSSTSKIKVLIVDDSALVRRAISDALALDADIEVVGVAHDPFIAREKILTLKPDVLTLDIEMPRMDGLTFLKVLAKHHPMPVLVISSLTEAGSEMAMECIEAGATEVLSKPDGSMSIGALGAQLASRVKAVYQAGVGRKRIAARTSAAGAHARPDAVHAPVTQKALHIAPRTNDQRLVVIGSSTGGIEALRTIIPALPADCPPTVIVQHIPAHFSTVLAQRLNTLSKVEVREAVEGDVLRAGLCLVAPGGHHALVSNTPKGYQIRLTQTPPVHFFRPAVDVLFKSASRAAGANTTAVLLTGMGSDGAQGMLDVLNAGGDTIAEDESTCIVFGMPRAAGLLNAVNAKVPLPNVAHSIAASLNRRPG
ncbi:chemotaxis response regulator protein-glutamate methylesterase [Comamonadaceae bacterium M7527]|nr:chemotaxis response regulator protein-glutamate methylesterase [Comamonadaceae bacterium M7527]